MLKVGVLISGRGSNLQALIDAAKDPAYPAQIAAVISNTAGAAGLDRARAANIPTSVIDHTGFEGKEGFEKALTEKLEAHEVQLVCLAGFMRLLSPWFVGHWRDRLINIHPSLLPAFPGLDTHKKAIAEGVKFAGCTVHFVRAQMDHGPIIAQAAVPVTPDDTEATLAARILEAEHRIYPQAVRWIAEGRVNVHDEKAFVAGIKTPLGPFLNPAEKS
jgi:phosphoribosylglycinamide formyltransferase-1